MDPSKEFSLLCHSYSSVGNSDINGLDDGAIVDERNKEPDDIEIPACFSDKGKLFLVM